MTKYKVLEYFQWGQLNLDKNQILLIEELDDRESSMVYVEHYPEKNQLVATQAVESMIFLKKIEKY